MEKQKSSIQTDLDEPILFRTTDAEAYKATVSTGSLWLRSDQHYRETEDQIRRDEFEGVNSSKLTIPLRIQIPNGALIQIEGSGDIGQQIIPHYIVSLHGTSISREQLASFGDCTFGISSLSRLSAEVLYRSSLKLRCIGYRFGQVHYQHAALAQSQAQVGAAAIKLGDAPPLYLNPLNTDVLIKKPIRPFIEQDEWRIVVFAKGYLNDDPRTPLQINVDPSHFYPYSP